VDIIGLIDWGILDGNSLEAGEIYTEAQATGIDLRPDHGQCQMKIHL